MIPRYLVRPRADQGLEQQAEYLATHASPKIAHRFLVAAHETFALLASEPGMGWRSKFKHPDLSRMRVFSKTRFWFVVPGFCFATPR